MYVLHDDIIFLYYKTTKFVEMKLESHFFHQQGYVNKDNPLKNN
jgi:hypothetical protein